MKLIEQQIDHCKRKLEELDKVEKKLKMIGPEHPTSASSAGNTEQASLLYHINDSWLQKGDPKSNNSLSPLRSFIRDVCRSFPP